MLAQHGGRKISKSDKAGKEISVLTKRNKQTAKGQSVLWPRTPHGTTTAEKQPVYSRRRNNRFTERASRTAMLVVR